MASGHLDPARSALLVTVLFAVGPFCLVPLVSAQAASVSGRVIDQDRRTAIAGAVVRVTGTGLSATTSGIGAFTISGMTAGAYEVRIRAAGYTDRTDSITVADAEDVTVLVAMSPNPIALEPIQVEARIGARTAWLGARGVFQRVFHSCTRPGNNFFTRVCGMSATYYCERRVSVFADWWMVVVKCCWTEPPARRSTLPCWHFPERQRGRVRHVRVDRSHTSAEFALHSSLPAFPY